MLKHLWPFYKNHTFVNRLCTVSERKLVKEFKYIIFAWSAVYVYLMKGTFVCIVYKHKQQYKYKSKIKVVF